MQSDSDVADYTQRIAQSWKVGSKRPRNGPLPLRLHSKIAKCLIQAGYGLEGALPDVTAFDITVQTTSTHISEAAIMKGAWPKEST